VLAEAQLSALEKKQDGLSFTTGNTHAFITGPKGWGYERPWYFRRYVQRGRAKVSVLRRINGHLAVLHRRASWPSMTASGNLLIPEIKTMA
jgi:hypothetical protein